VSDSEVLGMTHLPIIIAVAVGVVINISINISIGAAPAKLLM